jgi:hypothetical protein
MHSTRAPVSSRHGFLLALVVTLAGCAHAPGPREVAEAYARALEENRLAEAAALTSSPPDAQPAFAERYAKPEARGARVAAVREALPALQAHAPSLTLVETEAGWRVVEAPETKPPEEPRAVLTRFLEGVEAGDWRTAWSLLSEPLRARYTPERLREDYGREPLAAERVRRARLALEGPARPTDTGVEFPLGEARAVRLEREAGEYRVAAIE